MKASNKLLEEIYHLLQARVTRDSRFKGPPLFRQLASERNVCLHYDAPDQREI